MAEIISTNGFKILVDDEDLPLVNQHRWSAIKTNRRNFYAMSNTRGSDHRKAIYLHRLLTCAPENQVVDHLNGNALDNRRVNLRVCTRSENLRNTYKHCGELVGGMR